MCSAMESASAEPINSIYRVTRRSYIVAVTRGKSLLLHTESNGSSNRQIRSTRPHQLAMLGGESAQAIPGTVSFCIDSFLADIQILAPTRFLRLHLDRQEADTKRKDFYSQNHPHTGNGSSCHPAYQPNLSNESDVQEGDGRFPTIL